MKELVIITGHSQGLGLALTEELLKKPEVFILGFSRKLAPLEDSRLESISVDLSIASGCLQAIKHLDNFIQSRPLPEKIVLINNAARIGEINCGWNTEVNEVERTFYLNLTVPVLLQNTVCKYALNKTTTVEILNISSGAAVTPYYGWETYCAAKAGLEQASKVLALELETCNIPAKVWCLKPGVLDTAMQEQIRSSTKEQFKDIEKFKDYKANNNLLNPSRVAHFIAGALANPNYKSGESYDVRQYLTLV